MPIWRVRAARPRTRLAPSPRAADPGRRRRPWTGHVATRPTSRRLREALVRGARLGYAARGAVYLVIGGLAVAAALRGGRATGTRARSGSCWRSPSARGCSRSRRSACSSSRWRVLAGVDDLEGWSGAGAGAGAGRPPRERPREPGAWRRSRSRSRSRPRSPGAAVAGGGADAWTSAVMRAVGALARRPGRLAARGRGARLRGPGPRGRVRPPPAARGALRPGLCRMPGRASWPGPRPRSDRRLPGHRRVAGRPERGEGPRRRPRRARGPALRAGAARRGRPWPRRLRPLRLRGGPLPAYRRRRFEPLTSFVGSPTDGASASA